MRSTKKSFIETTEIENRIGNKINKNTLNYKKMYVIGKIKGTTQKQMDGTDVSYMQKKTFFPIALKGDSLKLLAIII